MTHFFEQWLCKQTNSLLNNQNLVKNDKLYISKYIFTFVQLMCDKCELKKGQLRFLSKVFFMNLVKLRLNKKCLECNER